MEQLTFLDEILPPRQGDASTALATYQPTALIALVSGGLDSDYAALWLRHRYPDRPMILFHNYMALMDWPHTLDHLELLAAQLGNCRRVVIQAVYELTGEETPGGYQGTTLRRLHDVDQHGPATDSDPAALPTLLHLWQHARCGMPPTTSKQWCTAYGKTQPFNVWARANRSLLGARPLLVSGERWAESTRRSKLARAEWRAIGLQPCRAWPDGWQMLWVRPGIDQPFHHIATQVLAAGIYPHEGYFLQGETLATLCDRQRDEQGRARLSCMTCLYTHDHHLATAHHRAPELIEPALQRIEHIEAITGKTWRRNKPIRPAGLPQAPQENHR